MRAEIEHETTQNLMCALHEMTNKYLSSHWFGSILSQFVFCLKEDCRSDDYASYEDARDAALELMHFDVNAYYRAEAEAEQVVKHMSSSELAHARAAIKEELYRYACEPQPYTETELSTKSARKQLVTDEEIENLFD